MLIHIISFKGCRDSVLWLQMTNSKLITANPLFGSKNLKYFQYFYDLRGDIFKYVLQKQKPYWKFILYRKLKENEPTLFYLLG